MQPSTLKPGWARVDERTVRTSLARSRLASFDLLLLCAALATACVRALIATGMGDYPGDAGPALTDIAHGNVSGFFSHQPAMGALSLFVRVPFVLIGGALHDSPMGLYRWGDLPCLLAVALVGFWLARVAGKHGTGRVGQALIVAVSLLNPLINDALYYGHPEELLTASLAVGALLAAADRRPLLAAALVGCAVASKQWALVIVCPVLLTCERRRLRSALVMAGVAAGATLPMIVGNFHAFVHVLHYISRPQGVTTVFTWLYPLTPRGPVRIANIFGAPRVFQGHTVPALIGTFSHPLIIALGVAIPLLVFFRDGRRLTPDRMLLAAALVLLLRCVLDPGSAGYYHLPLLLALLASDAVAGRSLPLLGLAGFAGAFTVLDRFVNYSSMSVANSLYIACTLIAAVLLVRRLASGERDLDGLASRSQRIGELAGVTAARPS
jgi:hypothetical protein